MIPDRLIAEVSRRLGEIQNISPVGGGCIHHAQKITTEKGDFFLKWNDISQGDNFKVESKGLALLAKETNLKIPQVLECLETQTHVGLVLEWIEQGGKSIHYFQNFGEKLAQLHLCTHPQFGLSYDNYIGALPQQNSQQKNGIDFFRDARLIPQLNFPNARKLLSTKTHSGFEKLFDRLPSLIPKEPPALLHGDLWGGNILTGTDGHAALIDPAVYYGHREAELAFMTLFDSYPEGFYDAYESVHSLTAGWKDRIDIFNLYPLLVHVNLFGGGYVDSVERIVKRLI